jgi:hypothetical protein
VKGDGLWPDIGLQGRQDEGRGMEMKDIDQEIEETTEKAMERLRKLLNETELREYERYYEYFRTAPSEDVRYYNAYRILRRYLAEVL